MNRNLLGLLVLSAFLPVFSAEAFLLPPFKLDASTIGNEIVSYGNTSSQTAGKGLQQAAIVQTAITYGQGAKEAYEFATKMLNDFKNVNLNNLGETLDKMSEAEAEPRPGSRKTRRLKLPPKPAKPTPKFPNWTQTREN